MSIEETTEKKINEGRKTRTDLTLLSQGTHDQQSLIYKMALI